MKKRTGAASYILAAVLGSILMSILAVSGATINSSLFRGHEASNIALQTRILAENKYDILRNKGYNHLAPEDRAAVNGGPYEREVLLGSEYQNDDGYKERDVTINVYRQDETEPRYSLHVTLSSQGSGNGSNIPQSAIIPWYGDLAFIPAGFAYCDGTNGTPDLRGRTLIGTGSWKDPYVAMPVVYNLGNIGGERTHRLTIAEMPSHNHEIWGDDALGWYMSPARKGVNYDWESTRNTNCISNWYYTTPSGGSQPHNVMQPYMAVHWIMKL